MGFRGNLSRSNLAYANQHRDWRLFEALAQVLMRRAARLYRDDAPDLELPQSVFALDASIIPLSLHLFPWGYYARSRRAAVKLHLMLPLQGNLPAWGAISEAHLPEAVNIDAKRHLLIRVLISGSAALRIFERIKGLCIILNFSG